MKKLNFLRNLCERRGGEKTLSLVVGSGTARKRLGNGSRTNRNSLDSIVSRLCLVSLICVLMLTLGAGHAWGLQ